jgi:hypothetical protein
MNRGTVSPVLPVKLTVTGRKYNDGLPGHCQFEVGSGKSMLSHLVCQQAANGCFLPGIFPGLFTRTGSGKKLPTQEIYLIKSDSLLIGSPWSLIFNSGGLNDRTK